MNTRKTSQTKSKTISIKTEEDAASAKLDTKNDRIKTEEVAVKLDTIISLLSLILKELTKNKSPFAE